MGKKIFKKSYMQKTDDLVIKFGLPSYIVKSFSVICASKVFLNVFVFKRVEFTKSTCKSPPKKKLKTMNYVTEICICIYL